jgi:hypothetical protein
MARARGASAPRQGATITEIEEGGTMKITDVETIAFRVTTRLRLTPWRA